MSTTSEAPVTLEHHPLSLPDELWIQVLLELDYFELKKASRICKKLNRIIQVSLPYSFFHSTVLHCFLVFAGFKIRQSTLPRRSSLPCSPKRRPCHDSPSSREHGVHRSRLRWTPHLQRKRKRTFPQRYPSPPQRDGDFPRISCHSDDSSRYREASYTP